MLNEIYKNKTTFYFGKDMETNIEEILRNKFSKILIHYGLNSLNKSKLLPKIKRLLNDLNISIYELGGVESNPKSDLVYEGIELCKKNEIDFILAIGGGSVIDSAKAIAIGSKYKDDFFDLFNSKAIPTEAIKIGVILTNAGSGSETSCTSVITNVSTNIKKAFQHSLMQPHFSILNPENTLSVPIDTTLYGIVDSICHIFERYFSNTQYVDCSNRISEALMQTLIKYAFLIKKDPSNYNYRAEIMWTCKLASDQLVYLGRKQEWTCHYIAHEIGAICDKSHGSILAVIFPHWMNYVFMENKILFLQFAKNIFNKETEEEGISALRLFFKELNMPTTLKELKKDIEKDFEKIALNISSINPSGTIGNFKRLDKKDINAILMNAL